MDTVACFFFRFLQINPNILCLVRESLVCFGLEHSKSGRS
ncbi:hypothetical protein NC651_021743 [Populus alba x Populus x berolinensis]|nr:hypothetical protein NC651_021743 [Populus alba x Populus x berolinensis]